MFKNSKNFYLIFLKQNIVLECNRCCFTQTLHLIIKSSRYSFKRHNKRRVANIKRVVILMRITFIKWWYVSHFSIFVFWCCCYWCCFCWSSFKFLWLWPENFKLLQSLITWRWRLRTLLPRLITSLLSWMHLFLIFQFCLGF